MDNVWKTGLWQQFGAAIDMFEASVRACPDELWEASLSLPDPQQPMWSQVWYTVLHVLKWLDRYLEGASLSYMPPLPFQFIEIDGGLEPERVYTKQELLTYLAECREKCRATILNMTDERAQEILDYGWMALPFAELQMYSMRHVQEHAAQLSLFIGQHTQSHTLDWISIAKSD